ncbi:TetR/AcrR family transcriptional regulator [Paenibacillus qinlingensis]|uniref:TetR/AcrR family transcriptional repressor of nem operon n=1 Tax=Paenibacillus qinlingensis TaxID=1837343 RepID=A0ABU1P5T1_9BACL|nr:TetR/AcrR family transcriptional regulator [Paenibacillus qinlingensis]MDR6555110.1 TetR/AcrR family transcriptional repressor of nem operon [Paenibacillus qinlingensis]
MGRNKVFDEDAVLLKAMHLFWKQGYEKTSMQELVSHMGIHKGSLYDTFGDKQSLYIRALKRYSENSEQSVKLRLADTRSVKEAIRMLFDLAIHQREDIPQGCFIVNTAVELSFHDAEARECVRLNWERVEEIIADLIVRGKLEGELAESIDADQLASFLNNALIGLRIIAKTITDRDKLNHIIEMNMSLLK